MTHETSKQLSGRPRFGRIPDGRARSGLSRASLYKIAAKHKGLFKKLGAATIVDLDMLDDIMAALPAADVHEAAQTAAAEATKAA